MLNQSSLHFLDHSRTYALLIAFFAPCEYRAISQLDASTHPPNQQISTPAASASDASPSFDVVSIKPSQMDPRTFGELGYREGTYRSQGWSLPGIISAAYLPPMMDQIVPHDGMPSWVQSERYDIVAKVDRDTAARLESATTEQRAAIIQSMVQKMLADRFGLIVHHAPIEVQGYALTVARKGPKLTLSRPSDVIPEDFRDTRGGGKARMVSKPGSRPEIDFFHVSAAELARELSILRNLLLVDETGLKGTYNFSLLPLDDSPVAGDESTQRDARLENTIPWDLGRLGLQIKPIRVKTETIVVDSIHRPTPN
jgi:uncharacterized protein (TIGR03435 family)